MSNPTARAKIVASLGRRATKGRDAGMTTAEYAVGTVAACGFGGLLYKVLTSGFVQNLLQDVISRALHFGL
jgi:hypothetical protein